MTFKDYIINQRSSYFYFLSLQDMKKINKEFTLEEWFPNMYADYIAKFGEKELEKNNEYTK